MADLGKTTKLLDFIRARIARNARGWTLAEAAAAADMDVPTCRASIGRLRLKGIIDHEPRDYSTIRILNDPAAPAPPKPELRRAKPFKADGTLRTRGRKKKHTSAPVAGVDQARGVDRTVVTMASTSGTLEASYAVTYDPAEREVLGQLVQRMLARAVELATLAEEQARDAKQVQEIYDALRASPPLGALGASLFAFLAQARAAAAPAPAKAG